MPLGLVLRPCVEFRSNLRVMYILFFLIVFMGMAACRDNRPFSIDCNALYLLVRTDAQSNFARELGSYQLEEKKLKLRDVSKYGWSQAVIPAYDYDTIRKFNQPFKGITFSVKKNHIDVTVFSMNYSTTRQHLSEVISAELFAKYKEKPLFTFLVDSIGLDNGASDFCAGNPDKSVRMFMSSVVLPIHAGKTHVYRLTRPAALLLVADKKTEAEFIFPNPKNRDALDYVTVNAPKDYIVQILGAVNK